MKKMRLAGRALVIAGVITCFLAAAYQARASDAEVETLRQQLESLSQQMKAVQDKLDQMEKRNASKEQDIEEMGERLDEAELHTATDKVSLGIELRSQAETMHYSDIRSVTDATIQQFRSISGMDFNTLKGMVPGMLASDSAADKRDADNDIAFTTKFRLNMKARVNEKLNFAGRLSAYKVWGDSTGVKFNQGSMGDVTYDGNTASLPHGDTIRLERAYFNYKGELGSVPTNFSVGRRPSTDGPPLEYGAYSLEGGSPLGTIINWQFDGASLNFGLEETTGIPGAALKLCYGVGYEGDWGNSTSLNYTSPDVEDVHLFGFIVTMFDDDTTSAVMNYAHASDITDGFTGLTTMPFIVSKEDRNNDGTNEYYFEDNPGGYVSRIEPATNIGDWDAASLLLRTNLSEWFSGIDLFAALSWSHTDPSRVSEIPIYELLGEGLLSSNNKLESRDGYSIYLGARFPMPWDAKLGLEYNWGSRYWFNFTGAEDSLIGSKLATRGQVFEAYYIQPIYQDNFFLKIGGRYYDYEYSGSGIPLGEPIKVDEVTSLRAMNAVQDTVWNALVSVTLRY